MDLFDWIRSTFRVYKDTLKPVDYFHTKQAGGPWHLQSLTKAYSYGGILPNRGDILLHEQEGKQWAFEVVGVTQGGGNDAHFVELEQIGTTDSVELPPQKETDSNTRLLD